MINDLGSITLKSGEPMQLVKTTAPQPDWTDRILPFLVHKGEFWLDPMREAYSCGLGDLVMNDFLGVLGSGEVVGNITTLEHLGVGILQHVFTPPEQRRKGICNALMQALCDDFLARGGRAMYLSTGYDSPPFHIYESFGFRGRGDGGKMTWLPEPGFLGAYFAPAATQVREVRSEDWPLLEALYATSGQWQLKSFLMQQFGHADYESEFIALRNGVREGKVLDTKVLVTSAGAVVGHALVGVQPQWAGRVLVLDTMVHASFQHRTGGLLAALEIPAGRKVQAFSEPEAEARIAALKAAGFREEGVLRGQFEDENHGARDAAVLAR
jgi:hypothetical protein